MADWVEAGQQGPRFHACPPTTARKVKLSACAASRSCCTSIPRDDTPGCTREACAFRDQKKALAKLGAMVLGVSTDDVASHVKFRDKFELNFPLLADVDHKVAEKYGAGAKRTCTARSRWASSARPS